MEDKLAKLKQRLGRVQDLYWAAQVLEWERDTYMPPGGAQARADQRGTLEELAHQFFVDEEVGALLDDLEGVVDQLDYDSDDASLIRFCIREYRKLVRVPQDLIAAISKQETLANSAWLEARAAEDFSIFEPELDKMIELKMRYAEILGSDSGNPYDALLDKHDPGMTYEYVESVFGGLKPRLIKLIADITANKEAVNDSVIMRDVPQEARQALCEMIIEALGFDLNRGRLDPTVHPFEASFSRYDVRLTTRFLKGDPMDTVMSTMHEAGHGLYEQNISPTLYRTKLARGSGMSVHESQSRLYENMLGRSRAFWTLWFPKLKETFSPTFDDVDFESFYKALNKSQPSLIRIEADEVTYGLHIMLRAELENDLFNGKVKTADLPGEWNGRMEEYLGIVPPNDRLGVLQDVHWSVGLMGYFPDYLLGSIMSVQLWNAMMAEKPEIESEIEHGSYGSILDWQRDKIHQHGSKFTFPELIKMATGSDLQWEPYMTYLTDKYSEIYELA